MQVQAVPTESVAAATSPDVLLTHALANVAGAALVLDANLRIVAATPMAVRILGSPLQATHVVKALGEVAARPLAEALAHGRAAMTTLARATRDEHRALRVRATPLHEHTTRIGWLLVLTEEAGDGVTVEHLGTMWTRDPAMKRLFALAAHVAQCDAHVLLDGETGTGKASFAAAIHAHSTRKNGPLRVIACAAATNESMDRQFLAGADGSELTLYFDELTELSPAVQARLVRVLDTATLAPVDGSPPKPVDVRILAATRMSLNDEIARGRFRPDLAYQLRVVSLHLPPLRSRRGDVALLATKLVDALNERSGRRIERVAPAALARLERHHWPGNVRELRAAIESAFAMGDGPVLTESELPRDVGAPAPAELPMELVRSGSDETNRIRRALEAASGDRVRAASILGMSRTTLWRRMRALGLLRPSE